MPITRPRTSGVAAANRRPSRNIATKPGLSDSASFLRVAETRPDSSGRRVATRTAEVKYSRPLIITAIVAMRNSRSPPCRFRYAGTPAISEYRPKPLIVEMP